MNRQITLLGLVLVISTSLRSPTTWANGFDPAILSHCDVLPEPISYYQAAKKQYFLAVDTCMKAAFDALELQPRVKPKRKLYRNVAEIEFGIPSASQYHHPILKLTGWFDENIGREIAIDLGFVKGQPENPEGYLTDTGSGSSHIPDYFRVCQGPGEKAPLVSCATLRHQQED